VRVEYVGRAPMEGSDDRVLASTLRQDEPAPLPGTVKLAATPIVPAAWTSSVPRSRRYASAAADDALPDAPAAGRSMAYAPQAPGADGTDQFLNGRGLY
jgi:rare lipoprotein A